MENKTIQSMKTIQGSSLLLFLPFPSLHVLHTVNTAATQTFSWGLFKRTGASLTVMYSSYRLNPLHPAAGDLLEGALRGKVKVLIELPSTRNAGTNASLLLPFSF